MSYTPQADLSGAYAGVPDLGTPATAVDLVAAQTITGAKTFAALRGQATQDTAPLGPNLITGTGWTFSGDATASGNGASFAGGGTGGSITQAVNVTAGATYQVTWTHSGSSGGNETVSLGSASGSQPWYYAQAVMLTAAVSGSVTFTFAGDSGYVGTVTNITVQETLGPSTPAALLVDGTGSTVGEIRGDSNGNSGFGLAALQSNTTGSNNSGFGLAALQSNTTGYNNSGFGLAALQSNTTGFSNSGFGQSALQGNTTGYDNSGFGQAALQSNTTGNNNSGFGWAALQGNTTGNNNSGFGQSSLYSNTTGNNNSGFGWAALYSQTTANNNSGFGWEAGLSPTTANRPVAGSNNVWVGYQSGPSNTTDPSNVVSVGYQALCGGAGAVAIGSQTVAGAAGSMAIGMDSAGTAATSATQDLAVIGTALTTVQVGKLSLSNPVTQTTAPAAGTAAALPATPAEYVQVTIAGTARYVAVY